MMRSVSNVRAAIRSNISHLPAPAILLLTLLALAGCGKKEVYQFPEVPLQTGHFMGSPLAPPATRPVPSFQPQAALQVQFSVVSIASMPDTLGVPLGTQVRFITATRIGRPVLPSTLLTRGSRLLTLGEPGALVPQLPATTQHAAGPATRTALEEGVTAVFRLSQDAASADPVTGSPLRRGVELALHRPATRPTMLQLAFTVDDLLPPAPTMREPDPPPDFAAKRTETLTPSRTDADAPAQALPQRETALLELPWNDQPATYAVLVPFSLTQRRGEALALILQVLPGDDSPEHAEALRAAQGNVLKSGQYAAARPTTLPAVASQGSALRIALESLRTPERRRASLVFLAGETHAPITADVALSADDALLGELVTGMLAAVDGAGFRDALDLGWILERQTLTRLGKLLAADSLPPELSTVLVFHCGEAGRQAGSFEELLRSLESREKFAAKLLAENLILLEDVLAASRVRANQWLVARKIIVPGYDPEAPAAQRRAAIERFYNQATTGAGK